MPEITANYIRLPISKGHSKHKLRTITISDAKQIKAIYCVDCAEIATYLFDRKRWTMKQAQKWVDEHEEDKSLDMDIEPLIEPLVEAYKAAMKFHKYTYNKIACLATRRRSSSRDDKKYMRNVKYKGKERLVHYGDPNLPMQRDNPERRANFLARHKCSTKTNPHAAGFWACYDWENTKEKSIWEGEAMDLDAVEVDGKEVLVEDLIEVYKAREDVTGEGAREKAKAAQKKRAEKYGIAIREDGNVTKPAEWKDVPDDQFGDPVNYAYPCPNKEQTQAALRYWGKPKNKAKYSEADQKKVNARLRKFAKKFKVGEFAEKALELNELEWKVRDAWRDEYEPKPKAVYDEPVQRARVRIFDDFVIVEQDDGLYKYDYTVDDEGHGEVSFDEPTKVEMQFNPVSKSLDTRFDFHIKRLGETDEAWRIGSYGLIWGSEEMRDLSPWPNADGTRGEFFTPETRGLDDLPVKAITFEHDKETTPEGEPFRHSLGTTVLERDDAIGRWVEAQIEKRRKYASYVMELVDTGQLTFSSETAGHWREVANNGEIKHWRTAGYTLTTHPMEPRLTDVAHLRAYYKSLDMDLAEPTTGGAPEDGGLERKKALSEIELLLLETEMEG